MHNNSSGGGGSAGGGRSSRRAPWNDSSTQPYSAAALENSRWVEGHSGRSGGGAGGGGGGGDGSAQATAAGAAAASFFAIDSDEEEEDDVTAETLALLDDEIRRAGDSSRGATSAGGRGGTRSGSTGADRSHLPSSSARHSGGGRADGRGWWSSGTSGSGAGGVSGGGPRGVAVERGAAPWYAYPVLAAAVLAVSSAGVVFASMQEVPALTLVAWRLSVTTLLLAPGAARQFWRMPPEARREVGAKAGALCGAGAFLALHFGAWVTGIQHTTLTHSLLFVSATPLVIAAGTWAMRRPISAGELAGAAAGLAGACLLVLDGAGRAAGASSSSQPGSQQQPGTQQQPGAQPGAQQAQQTQQQGQPGATLAGDAWSFVGCVAVIPYLFAGRWLRAWMPIFVYAFLVTGVGALLLCGAAVASDGAPLGTAPGRGLLGWANSQYALKVLYLAAGPGVVGHTGFNALLRWLPPLVISLAIALEPVVGSALGWALLGLPPPGAWTWAGGALVLGGTAVTTVAAHRREAARASRRHAAVALSEAFGGNGSGNGNESINIRDGDGDSPGGDGGWRRRGSIDGASAKV